MYTYGPNANMARKVAPLTVALAMALGLVEQVRAAAPVTSCLDDGGFDTLRHAVLTANPSDMVDLSKLAFSKITLLHGALSVGTKDLTIQGPGAAKLTIDGNQADRVFMHIGAGTLGLVDVTVANGKISADKAYGGCIYSKGSISMARAALTGCKAMGKIGAVGGGALAFKGMTADSSLISGNLADASVGQGAGQMSALGGGAVAEGTDPGQELKLRNSIVSGNTVHAASGMSEGGGVLGVNLNVKYSTLTNNKASAIGDDKNYSGAGGMAVLSSLFMLGSTVDNNQADLAGGMLIAKSGTGFVTIVQSTISTNHGNLGIGSNIDFSIANSTIAFNSAGVFGGGGLALDGSANATLQSTIIADNTPGDLDGGAMIGGANNIIKLVGSTSTAPAGTLALDPQLGPLAYNGGTTRTHALSANSPAIDAGNNGVKLLSDQRSGTYARVIGLTADIGAIEFDPDRIFADGFKTP